MNAASPPLKPSISPAELRELLTQNCTLIDVREPVEYAEEHLAPARLMPMGQLLERADELKACPSPIIVMCRSGKRGSQAREKLLELGFDYVSNLEGGILAWKEHGYDVVSGSRKGLPLMQQVQLIIGLGVLTGVVLSRIEHPNWVFLSAFFGAGLVFAGSTGWCGLAILLSKMPWNHVANKPEAAVQNCSLPR